METWQLPRGTEGKMGKSSVGFLCTLGPSSSLVWSKAEKKETNIIREYHLFSKNKSIICFGINNIEISLKIR